MSDKVARIELAEISAVLSDDFLASPALEFIHISHKEHPVASENLLHIARKNDSLRHVIARLSTNGFHLYALRDGVSSYVRHGRIRTLWNKVVTRTYEIDENGIVYTFTPAPLKSREPKLLVVFSSIAASMYNASLNRYFEQNFKSINKYVPEDTAVLRIADIGGVLGAFYLDTNHLSDNERNIQALIGRVVDQHGMDRFRTTFYGVSKGGTGALYHAILGGYNAVVVDPIVSDAHYVEKYNDLHFTRWVHPQEKQSRFNELALRRDLNPSRVAVVYSRRSPQYPYINDIVGGGFGGAVSFFDSDNPRIRKHPDVGPATINSTVMLINMTLYGLDLPQGRRTII